MEHGFAALGPVMQMAYVPSDFDAALRYWTQVIGAGPFFMLPEVELAGGSYRGAPSSPKFTMALGYWGEMQIELIKPISTGPSIYSDEYGVRDQLHHLCILVDDIRDVRAACAAHGADILFEGPVGDSGAVIYADTGGGAGMVLEFLQPMPGSRELFAMMRDAAKNWDGSDPIRSLA